MPRQPAVGHTAITPNVGRAAQGADTQSYLHTHTAGHEDRARQPILQVCVSVSRRTHATAAATDSRCDPALQCVILTTLSKVLAAPGARVEAVARSWAAVVDAVECGAAVDDAARGWVAAWCVVSIDAVHAQHQQQQHQSTGLQHCQCNGGGRMSHGGRVSVRWTGEGEAAAGTAYLLHTTHMHAHSTTEHEHNKPSTSRAQTVAANGECVARASGCRRASSQAVCSGQIIHASLQYYEYESETSITPAAGVRNKCAARQL